jgi:hypothetical protein
MQTLFLLSLSLICYLTSYLPIQQLLMLSNIVPHDFHQFAILCLQVSFVLTTLLQCHVTETFLHTHFQLLMSLVLTIIRNICLYSEYLSLLPFLTLP